MNKLLILLVVNFSLAAADIDYKERLEQFEKHHEKMMSQNEKHHEKMMRMLMPLSVLGAVQLVRIIENILIESDALYEKQKASKRKKSEVNIHPESKDALLTKQTCNTDCSQKNQTDDHES